MPMLVRSPVHGNAIAAKSRCLSQLGKRYVTSARDGLTVAQFTFRVSAFSGFEFAAINKRRSRGTLVRLPFLVCSPRERQASAQLAPFAGHHVDEATNSRRPPMIQLGVPGALSQRRRPNVNAKHMPPHTSAMPSVAISHAVSFSTWRDTVTLARQRAKW